MTTRATITGWGKCAPPVKLTNEDLAELVDTTDEWIVERTGIRERGISHVETTDMAEVAALRALAAAGLEVTDIDMLIVATVTPEITCPSNACYLQERLGAVNAAAFDLNAACSGWVYGTATASSMIESSVAQRVLLVGAEKLHWVMDYWDRTTCILFGDGAGAAVFEPSTAGDGVLATDLGADGVAGSTMVFSTLGTRGPLTGTRDPFEHRLHFEGQAVFKIAVKGIEASVTRALERAGLGPDEVALVVPHQANERIIDAAARRLGIEPERVMVNIATHGNSAAASIPMALADAVDEGRVEAGDVVVKTAFGGGVTWGSVVMRWGDRVEPIAKSDVELPPTDKTVFELLQANRDFYAPVHADDAE
jgi:3-oxoacyl-[acyl-carrier-protein] synthase-3